MYYNNNRNYPTDIFLNNIHTAMKNKYQKRKAKNAKAYKLQNFFRDLKFLSSGNLNELSGQFDLEVLDLIRYNIQTQTNIMGSGFKVKNLFLKSGGTRFERELASVYEAVWNEVSLEKFDVSKVLIGAEKGNINFSGLNNLSEEIVKDFGVKTYRVIEDKMTKNKTKEYYLPDVDGKIDVKGYRVQIKSNPSQKMLEIYNMLKDCTFSAKNYNSMSWDEKAKEYIKSTHTVLTLGNSNIFRALYGVLSDLNYKERTIESAIYAGYNRILRGEDDVADHFHHMRFIYELIGSGITYNGKSYGNVQFLIYNDPSGNIYVKDTHDIISDLFNEALNLNKKWNSAITLSKDYF